MSSWLRRKCPSSTGEAGAELSASPSPVPAMQSLCGVPMNPPPIWGSLPAPRGLPEPLGCSLLGPAASRAFTPRFSSTRDPNKLQMLRMGGRTPEKGGVGADVALQGGEKRSGASALTCTAPRPRGVTDATSKEPAVPPRCWQPPRAGVAAEALPSPTWPCRADFCLAAWAIFSRL